MTIGMEQHTVLCGITATVGSPDDMMVVPTGEHGDFLVANGAKAILFFPKMEQLPSLPEIVNHLNTQAFFKIAFPSGIVGIGMAFDFGVPLDRRISGRQETHHFTL